MTNKLVIVADGSRAQLLSAKGRKLHSVIQEIKNEDIGTHGTDSLKESRTGAGHFYNPNTSIKLLEKQSFAKNLTQEINQRMLNGNFDSIILVASPQMLGMLRKQLNDTVVIDRSLSLEATRLCIEQLEARIFN